MTVERGARGARRDWLTQALLACERRFADTGGHTLHYLDEAIEACSALATLEAGLEALVHEPVLLFWDDKDMALREKERAPFACTFPRARTVALPGAGHCLQEDSPPEIAAAIGAW